MKFSWILQRENRISSADIKENCTSNSNWLIDFSRKNSTLFSLAVACTMLREIMSSLRIFLYLISPISLDFDCLTTLNERIHDRLLPEWHRWHETRVGDMPSNIYPGRECSKEHEISKLYESTSWWSKGNFKLKTL